MELHRVLEGPARVYTVVEKDEYSLYLADQPADI